MSQGALRDTYLAALQHDLIDIPEGATLVGVVRSPTRWFSPAVDENQRALGPPQSLLDEFKQRSEGLEAEGLDDADAHNAAWEDVDFEPRYREHLNKPPTRTQHSRISESGYGRVRISSSCVTRTPKRNAVTEPFFAMNSKRDSDSGFTTGTSI